MMMWSKFDVYEIIEHRNGAIYKTKKTGSVWVSFPYSKEFEPYITHGNVQYIPTSEIRFQKDKPLDY